MSALLKVLPLFLIPGLALAANMEEAVNTAPSETVPVVFVWLFLFAFVAMIVGFFGYVWWQDKNRKPGE